MAKKNQKTEPLSFTEIVLRGDSETIRQALEARVQIDGLLDEREAAYQRIAELENQVETIVGEDGIFPFPSPPAEVSAFSAPAKKTAKPAAKKVVAEPIVDENVSEFPESEEVQEDESGAEESEETTEEDEK
ncbi:hypothetical protein MLD52_03740 [Puniceicoccaceae bacterium K14]|nr:hypothetical protein [Puniceicoccaceae bacterium K14]